MFNEFPYTNFHDLNTDWLIKAARQILDVVKTIDTTIDEGINDKLLNKIVKVYGSYVDFDVVVRPQLLDLYNDNIRLVLIPDRQGHYVEMYIIYKDDDNITYALYNPNGAEGPVISVNGYSGVVNLTPGDIGASPAINDAETTSTNPYSGSKVVAVLNAAIQEINVLYYNLQTRVATAEQTIETHGTRINAAETRIGELDSFDTVLLDRIGSLENGELAIRNRMTTAETNIGTLNTNVNTQATQINGLDTRVSALEAVSESAIITVETPDDSTQAITLTGAQQGTLTFSNIVIPTGYKPVGMPRFVLYTDNTKQTISPMIITYLTRSDDFATWTMGVANWYTSARSVFGKLFIDCIKI